MSEAERNARAHERSTGQTPPAPRASSITASARTGLEQAAPPSPGVIARARRLPPQAFFAGFGIAAVGLIVSTAVFLRSSDAVDALEQSMAGEGPAASPSGAPSAGPTSSAGAPPPGGASQPAKSPGEPAKAVAEPESRAPASKAPIMIPEGDRASEADLGAARASGPTALEQLLKKHPRDLYVLKALVSAYSLQKNHAGAMAAATRLLAAAPAFGSDGDIEQALLMAANGPPNASAVALDLMATKLGERGADMLYELHIAPNIGKLPKDRAGRLLKEEPVRKLASPALLVAVDLKNTPPCTRKGLYERARDHGDARSLVFLKPMTSTSGCGFLKRSDCFSCLEPRKELYDTIAAIQKRLQPSAANK